MDFHHVSVLRKETIANLITDTSGVYVDCTLGGGGHSKALADQLTGEATIIVSTRTGTPLQRQRNASLIRRADIFSCSAISGIYRKSSTNFTSMPSTASCLISAYRAINWIHRTGDFLICRTGPSTCAWTAARGAALTTS